MAAPKGNPLDIQGKGLEYGVRDTFSGAEDILKGNVSKGLWGATGGALQMVGGRLLGFQGQASQQDVANEAGAQATKDVEQATMLTEQARRDAIQKRLEEAIKLRQKAPGKAQTLLTSNIAPNTQYTGTLVTPGGKG